MNDVWFLKVSYYFACDVKRKNLEFLCHSIRHVIHGSLYKLSHLLASVAIVRDVQPAVSCERASLESNEETRYSSKHNLPVNGLFIKV